MNNHVPAMVQMQERMARPQSVEAGIKNRASNMPNWTEDMVAPVVEKTNLFMHSCCMIRPAILIATPMQSRASNEGRRGTGS